jgi:hypothetical protein
MSNKYEIYQLTNKILDLKKKNEMLEKEKRSLELSLSIVESKKKSKQNVAKIPEMVENILDDLQQPELTLYFEKLIEHMTCIVCNTDIRSVLYTACKHLVVCDNCSLKMPNICPICRTVSHKSRIYI